MRRVVWLPVRFILETRPIPYLCNLRRNKPMPVETVVPYSMVTVVPQLLYGRDHRVWSCCINRVFSCRQLSKSNIQKHTKILSICIVSISLNTKTQIERVTIPYLCNLRQKLSDAHHKSADAKPILMTDKTLSYKMRGVKSIHSTILQFLPPHYWVAYYFMVDKK